MSLRSALGILFLLLNGSDTKEPSPHKAWTRQHAAIKIDQQRDGISDSDKDVWNFFSSQGSENVIVMGRAHEHVYSRPPFCSQSDGAPGHKRHAGPRSDGCHVQPGPAAVREPMPTERG